MEELSKFNTVYIDDLPLRSVDTENGYAVFKFLGLPFIGQMKGNLDLHKTRFSPKTDFGDITVPLKTYIDHGQSLVPELRYQSIGIAKIGDETPDGRLIDVFISQRSKYLNLLMELKERDMLRGSAQALASLYQTSPDGEILRFHLGEFSMTTSPSNDMNNVLSVEIIRSILNKTSFAGVEMKKDVTTLEATVVEDVARAVEIEVEDDKDEMVEGETPAAKKVKRVADIIAEVEAEEVARTATVEEVKDADLMRGLTVQIDALMRKIESFEDVLRSVSENQADLADAVVRRLPKAVAAASAAITPSEKDAYSRIASVQAQAAGNRSGLRSPHGGD